MHHADDRSELLCESLLSRWRAAVVDGMKACRMSYRALGEETGIDHAHIWKLVTRESRPTLETAAKLLDALGGGLEIKAEGVRQAYLIVPADAPESDLCPEPLAVVVARSRGEAVTLYLRGGRTTPCRAEPLDVGTIRVIRFRGPRLEQ